MNGMALRVSPLAKEIDQDLREKSLQALQDNAKYIEMWEKAEANGEHDKPPEASATVSADPELFEALTTWRAKLAIELGKPPYIIAHNATLERVAAVKPGSDIELLEVPGFGPKKVETYGADILKIVKDQQAKSK